MRIPEVQWLESHNVVPERHQKPRYIIVHLGFCMERMSNHDA